MQLFHLVFTHKQRGKNQTRIPMPEIWKSYEATEKARRYEVARKTPHVKNHSSTQTHFTHSTWQVQTLQKQEKPFNTRLASFISGKSTSHSNSTACRGNHGLLS